jgi:plastocyanin
MRRPSVVALVVLAVVVVSLSVVAGVAARGQQATTLTATVGPGFTITLRNAQGTVVTRLDPGTYEIEVNDLSEEHNFHLSGPGVNRATSVGGTGTERWTVTLTDGRYSYVCDPHAGQMNGGFVVGTPAEQPPPPPPSSNLVRPGTRLVLTSGPGFRITLRTAAGRTVTRMRVGTYRMTVRDRSRIHNARVRAPGYNRATTLSFVGTQSWRVRLPRPGTLRFVCDPHAAQGMRGSARIVR